MVSSFFLSILNLSSTHSGSKLFPFVFSCSESQLLPTSSCSSSSFSSLSHWVSPSSASASELGFRLSSKSGCWGATVVGTGELSSVVVVAIAGLSPCQWFCVCVRVCVPRSMCACVWPRRPTGTEKRERGARNTPCVFFFKHPPPPSLSLVHKTLSLPVQALGALKDLSLWLSLHIWIKVASLHRHTVSALS